MVKEDCAVVVDEPDPFEIRGVTDKCTVTLGRFRTVTGILVIHDITMQLSGIEDDIFHGYQIFYVRTG